MLLLCTLLLQQLRLFLDYGQLRRLEGQPFLHWRLSLACGNCSLQQRQTPGSFELLLSMQGS